MSLDQTEFNDFTSSVGSRFFNLKKELKPGESMDATITDVSKNSKTKYPLKGKDYGLRIAFTDNHGENRIWDISGFDLARQATGAVYPKGLEGGKHSAKVQICRRIERSTKQSEGQIIVVSVTKVSDSLETPF